ncbi:GA-binding protein subunit beta-1 [Planococcus citri]|uniref:GA-binding protein subunit beta-1 n=1 Tax=Planococcus citri TaxID=170843 RepID=UPI0031F999DD
MNEKRMSNKEYYSKSTDGATLVDNSKLLIEAVKQGNEALVIKLLNAGVPPYVSDQLGCNSFFYAARFNRPNVLKLLLDAGALINVMTKMGRTALQIAAYHGHNECVEFLLNNDASVNDVDNLGMSALHWASENGHFDSVILLLKAGASVGLVSKFGKTALSLALKKNHFEIYDLLRQHLNNLNESTEFLLDEEFLNSSDKGYGPYTAVFIPDKNSFSDQKTSISSPILFPEMKNNIEQCKLAFNANLKNDDTIKLFEQHGIKLLPVDQSTIIASALKRGQTAVLTDAGKLALKKTEPNIIRKIAGMSTNHLNSQPVAKKQKLDNENTGNSSETPITATSSVTNIDNIDVSSLNKAKIIKIDAKQLVNLTAKKKLIISKPKQMTTSPVRDGVLQMESLSPNSTFSKNPNVSNNTKMKEFEDQLRKKTNLLRDMKKQLDLSLQLAKHYKSQYEIKEREAALYKIQLNNLSKILMNSGIKITTVNS